MNTLKRESSRADRGWKLHSRFGSHPLSSILHSQSGLYSQSAAHPARRRRGFSFAEVMFAVVILGIGFIMVAAVFPVAIQQTQNNGEENIAAALARQAANSIASLPTTLKNPCYVSGTATGPASVQMQLLFPPTVKNYVTGANPATLGTLSFTNYPTPLTGTLSNVSPPAIVVPLTGNRWDLIRSNLILPTDPRYAFVGFYKRENGSSAAQLIIIAVASRNHPIYTSGNDNANYVAGGGSSAFTISTAAGDFKVASTGPPVVPGNLTLITPDIINGSITSTAFEGCYVNVPVTTTPPVSPQGRCYSIGRPNTVSSPTYFEINPGDSMALTAGSSGLWGTSGAVTDTPAAATSAYLLAPATLQPTVAYAQLYTTATSPNGQIIIDQNPVNLTATATPTPAAVTGAYVIIADDFPLNPIATSTPAAAAAQDYNLQQNITPAAGNSAPTYSVGSLNGRIFRLGTPVTTSGARPGTFNLDPTYGMRPASAGNGYYSPDTVPNPDMVFAGGTNSTSLQNRACAKVYIIGAGRTDPNPANTGYSTYAGPAQDIGVFSTFFQVQ